MIRVGFMGRTKMLADTIQHVHQSDKYEVAFIWTSHDEDYYEYKWENFQQLAEDIGCPFYFGNKVKDDMHIVDADVIVSINFVNIIPEDFMNKFKHGVINAHMGDLPRYKGNACANWAILNNENKVVLTIHQMASDLDSGPIFTQSTYPLNSDTYITDIYEWFAKKTPLMFLETIDMINDGIQPRIQKGRTLRTFPRKPEDARLDFSNDIEWNHKLIRASSKPFAGAYCYLNNGDTKITIWRAKQYETDYDFYAIDGQIMERFDQDKTFLISIKNKALHVTDYEISTLSKEDAYRTICKSLRNRLN